MILTLVGWNREIVDARDPTAHEALIIELPVLVAVRPEPIASVVVPFVGESNGDAIALTCPKFFNQSVVEFLAHVAS